MANDCSTNLLGMAALSANWKEIDCDESNNWCGGADLNHISDVDIEDLAEFISYWLQ
jgi:hypothetical protein